MSNGDEPDTSADAEDASDSQPEETPPADDAQDSDGSAAADPVTARLDEIASTLESAETEAALDDIEATLEEIETDLADTDLPEDPDESGPRDRLEELREALESARGPYAADVVDTIETANATVTAGEWTDAGMTDTVAAVEAFTGDVAETLAVSIPVSGSDVEQLSEALEAAASAVADAGLDPDADAAVIADLVAAADELTDALDAAEEWDDLSVREQLQAEGFYDRLTPENRKDFPPEWGVIRIAERENDPGRILRALESFESNFMEENALDALRRLAPLEAFDPMLERAEKRDQPAIRVLGKIGDDRAVDTLVEFIRDESNPPLQKVVLRALGEIGSESATQAVANRLGAEDPAVRSHAARALGRIGDTRAIEPLTEVLETDGRDSVRAAAAWALNQIGTERALRAAAEYADDRAFVVQTEAEKARDAEA